MSKPVPSVDEIKGALDLLENNPHKINRNWLDDFRTEMVLGWLQVLFNKIELQEQQIEQVKKAMTDTIATNMELNDLNMRQATELADLKEGKND